MNTTPEFVVAIGASAGGLIPLQELVENLPDDIGNISIIIAQHLSPEYKSMLADIISRKTKLQVTSIIDGEQLQSNHIYITPPSYDAIFKQHQLETVDAGTTGPRPSIDRLFTSLAKNFKQKAVAIILSGTGQDGSKGIVQVKNAGGLTFCQSLETAKYSGMPQAAINTGKIDAVLSPEMMGKNLVDMILYDRPVKHINNDIPEDAVQEDLDDTTRLLKLVQERLGTNFNNYKSNTIIRRIQKRMKDTNFPNLKQYLLYIESNEAELDSFFEYLLIGVTSFFRDEEAFDALKEVLTDKIVEKESKSSFRVWIPGCATGEETVTVSIILHELIRSLNRFDLRLQIFATDINAKALKTARRGLYAKDKVEKLPPELINRYFQKEKDQYVTTLDIKNSILYTVHDVTANPPFLRLDLISCRNLFIYFNQLLQNQLFPIFHYSLNSGGVMFLGKSESIGNFKNLFNTINSTYRIFNKKEVEQASHVRLPSKKLAEPLKHVTSGGANTKPGFTLHDMVKETLYCGFDKPYVVVDETANIIEISGNINPFISLKPGAVNINLLRLINEDYQLEVRALLTDAVKNKKVAAGRLRRVQTGDLHQLMRITATPLQYSKPTIPYFMLVFDVLEVDLPFILSSDSNTVFSEQQRIDEMEYELQANKQHMNTLVEQLETGNEELQALNEELQSSNEELQASNEELETSNEELQATNEELENAYLDLRTITGKLTQQKDLWEQLSNASPDMIAVLRGDNFIVEYVNKPFQNLYPNKKLINHSILSILPELVEQGFYTIMQEVRNSSKSRGGIEAMFEADFDDNGLKEKKYFSYTLAPLLSDNATKADIVVYAKDVTSIVVARKQVEEDAKFFGTLAEAMPQKVWVTDKTGTLSYVNKTFNAYFGTGDLNPNDVKIDAFIHPDELNLHHELLQKSLDDKIPYNIRYRLKNSKGQYKWHTCSCRPLFTAADEIGSWICAAVDIDEEKTIEEKKDEFMSIASHELKTPLTTLTGYLELLLKVLEDKDCDTAVLYTERAAKSLGKISALVEDLLDISRIETGQLKFSKVNIDFDKMVKETVEDFEPFAVKHPIKLELASTNAVIYGDSSRLNQVMTNLLNNAVKYSDAGNRIYIRTGIKEFSVFFEVEDSGAGIPEQYMDKIFERFFRISDKGNFGSGMGIGLYISKEIIKKHQGKISVRNNKNKGAAFRVELPIVI